MAEAEGPARPGAGETYELHRRYFEQTSEGVWCVGFDEPIDTSLPAEQQIELIGSLGHVLQCNDVFAAMYGYPNAAAMIGARVSGMSVRDGTGNRELGLAFIRDGYQLVDGETCEHDVQRREKWFLNNMVGELQGGRLVRMWGTQRDVTERRRMLDRLRDSEQRFRALIEHSADGVALLGPDMNVMYASPAAERIFGWPAQDFIATGQRHTRLAYPGDEREFEARFAEARENPGRPVEFGVRVRHQNGRYLNIEGSLTNLLHEPAVQAVVVNYRDVTERRLAEERLHESERRLNDILDSFEDMVYSASPDGRRLLYANPAAERIFGVPVGEALERDMPWADRIHPDDHAIVFGSSGSPVVNELEMEYRVVRPDGAVRWVRSRRRVIRDEHGTPLRIEGIISDNTERKRVEKELLEARKLESIGRLAGGVAHDFNNILTVILGHTEPGAPPSTIANAEIRQAALRARDVTHQLLAIARRQILTPRAVSLNAVLRQSEWLLRRLLPAGVRLELRLDPHAWPIKADPAQLQQVVLNLAMNAGDAMPRGGSLLLETANVERGEPGELGDPVDRARGNVQARPPAAESPQVMLRVTDTGIGIPDEIREHVFEPFFTTKSGIGTGLGLATVYGIVNQSDGRIEVASEAGKGTRFTILLPRTFEEPAPAASEALESTQERRDSLLVVEDDDHVRGLIVEILRRAGHDVVVATHPQQALDLAAEHPGIRLLVTDVIMPGMNGSELADLLLDRYPGLKVLFVSGYPQNAAGETLLRAGVNFLSKPFTPTLLLEAVQSALA